MAISRDQTPADREIFVDNGKAVAFYLYGTQEPGSAWALSEGARGALRDKINTNGGIVCNRREDARVIIVSHREGLERLKHQYSTRRTHVEKPAFLDACIRDGRYGHKPILQRGMGGRVPGKERQDFTVADDRKLCEYIAARIPDEAAGGRTGTGVYDEVIELALANPGDPELEWALRHPAESWRERYKKNRDRLNPIIDRIVKANPPPPDGKGLYHLSRFANRRRQHVEFMQKNAQLQLEDVEGEEEEEWEEEEEEEEAGEFFAQPEGGEQLPPFEEPQPARRTERRHTYIGLSRHREGSQRRDRRSAPDRIPPRKGQELSFEDMEDYPFEPPSPQAGPSGTRRTPSPSPPPPAKEPPAPRPIRTTAAKRLAVDQVPMSSQATLVNPTQPRSTASSSRQPEEREDADAPSQKRRRTRAQIYVLLDPPRTRGRNRPPPQQDEDEDEDEDEEPMYEEDEEAQSPPVGRTNEEAQEVEDLLGGGSFEQSVRVSPAPADAASDGMVMDSEDERARKKLSLGRPRARASRVQSIRAAASHKRPLPEIEVEDMAAFAQGLDLGFRGASRRPSASASAGAGSSALALLRQRAQLQGRGQEQGNITPSASRSLQREPSAAESTSASSSEKGKDPVNRVPLDGTRASAQKKTTRESARQEDGGDFAAANQAYFDQRAHQLADHGHGHELGRKNVAAMRKAWPEVFNEDDTVAMDYACGMGHVSQSLCQYVKSVIGVDISQVSVDQFNAQAENQGLEPDEMRAVCAELKGEPGELDGLKFDVVMCCASYHHFPSIPETTRVLASFLKPGGSLLVADIKAEEDGRVIFPEVHHHLVPHTRGLSEETMCEAFGRAGLAEFEMRESFRAKMRSTGEYVRWFVARGVLPHSSREQDLA
ncbi:hypothetical protein V8D89_003768 [Ganoderma adspersum]